MLMREFIKQMYQAIQEGDVNLFDDIEDKIKKGDIDLTVEDVVPLCRMIIIDSEYIEYSQIIEIARMTLWAVEAHNMQEGLREYVKGLEEIYDELLLIINKGKSNDYDKFAKKRHVIL